MRVMMNDLDAKIICAEQLLFRIAAALRRVPFDERTKALHLRALKLKATIRELRDGTASAATCEQVLDQLNGLLVLVGKREWS
jgi:hypothetical protein